jgi:hypothetical protein
MLTPIIHTMPIPSLLSLFLVHDHVFSYFTPRLPHYSWDHLFPSLSLSRVAVRSAVLTALFMEDVIGSTSPAGCETHCCVWEDVSL